VGLDGSLGPERTPLELAARLVHLLNQPTFRHPRTVRFVHPSLQARVVLLAAGQGTHGKHIRQDGVARSRGMLGLEPRRET
jgi:hypothetical protein